MSKARATLEGWKEIAARLSPGQLQSAARTLLTRVGVIVERNTRIAAPVRTGALRRSITHQVEGVSRVIIGTNLNYAPVVNKRRRFMERGLEKSQSEIRVEMQRVGERFLGGN